MNTTKRKLELSSAIIGIVIYAILTIISLLGLLGTAVIGGAGGSVGGQEGAALSVAAGLLTVILVICLIFSVAGIVLGSLLCKKPNQLSNGAYSNRLGLNIAFIVLNVILFVMECISVSWFGIILVAVILALAIASVCMKHKAPEETAAFTQDEVK